MDHGCLGLLGMKKSLGKTILWTLGTMVVLFVSLPSFMSWLLYSNAEITQHAMEKSEFLCADGTEVVTRRWSKAGYERYCGSKKHGRWEAWSDGYKKINGEYIRGEKHGVWYWYNKDGSVSKTVSYDNGIEINARMPKN